jgi:hypothetical protein
MECRKLAGAEKAFKQQVRAMRFFLDDENRVRDRALAEQADANAQFWLIARVDICH